MMSLLNLQTHRAILQISSCLTQMSQTQSSHICLIKNMKHLAKRLKKVRRLELIVVRIQKES